MMGLTQVNGNDKGIIWLPLERATLLRIARKFKADNDIVFGSLATHNTIIKVLVESVLENFHRKQLPALISSNSIKEETKKSHYQKRYSSTSREVFANP